MKLKELHEAISFEPKTPKGSYKSMEDSGYNRLGRGVEANVFNARIGNSVIKEVILQTTVEEHAYTKFLKIVDQHKDNPFFPRIYSAKWYTKDIPSRGKRTTLVVKMEKLHTIIQPNLLHMLPTLLNQIGVPDNILALFPFNPETQRDIDMAEKKFKRLIDTPSFQNELIKNARNPQFVEAMHALEPLRNTHTFDLHFDNMMFRLTKNGPQLVITDPFFELKPSVGDV